LPLFSQQLPTLLLPCATPYYPTVAARPSANNAQVLEAVVLGPAESPFQGGLLALTIRWDRRVVEFTPPIFHCNVDPGSGELGFSFGWTAESSMSSLLSAVNQLLVVPDVAVVKNRDA